MASEKDLIKLVKSIRGPTNLGMLMKSAKIAQLSAADKSKAKELLVGLLGAGVRLGYIHEYKGHYSNTANVDDMIALVVSDSQSDGLSSTDSEDDDET